MSAIEITYKRYKVTKKIASNSSKAYILSIESTKSIIIQLRTKTEQKLKGLLGTVPRAQIRKASKLKIVQKSPGFGLQGLCSSKQREVSIQSMASENPFFRIHFATRVYRYTSFRISEPGTRATCLAVTVWVNGTDNLHINWFPVVSLHYRITVKKPKFSLVSIISNF